MKKAIFSGLAVAFVVLCYFLFEPVIVWAIGWEAFPQKYLDAQNVAIEDAEFIDPITKSQKSLSISHSELRAPAISIAVGINNKIVWAEARGFSDLKNERAASVGTKFRVGSVSKAVTSSGLGKLLENEKVKLDDSAGKYLPYFKSPEITVRQLASHTSGIRNYEVCFCFPIWEYYNLGRHHTIEESIDVFNGDPLLFEPGTGFSYSTYNYTVLSGVLERASGKNFLDFMSEEIFIPVGMTQTSGDYTDSLIEDRATFYEINNGEYKEAFPVDNSNKWAGGGFISTPSDLVKLGNALLNSTILKKETVASLFRIEPLEDGTPNPQNYTLGWRKGSMPVLGGKKEVSIVHHGGTALGATALLILFPEYQMSIAVATNRQSESFELIDHIMPIAKHFIVQLER